MVSGVCVITQKSLLEINANSPMVSSWTFHFSSFLKIIEIFYLSGIYISESVNCVYNLLFFFSQLAS